MALPWTPGEGEEAAGLEQRLFDACMAGQLDEAAALVAAGVRPSFVNEYGRTALHGVVGAAGGAAEAERAGLLRALIQAGAAVNAATRLTGATPLHLAAMGGAPPGVIELLLSHGADASLLDNSRKTAGDYAVEHWRAHATPAAYASLALLHGAREMLALGAAGLAPREAPPPAPSPATRFVFQDGDTAVRRRVLRMLGAPPPAR